MRSTNLISSVNVGNPLKKFSLEGNQFILGCHFSSLGEAKIGISLRLFRKEWDSLQKADFFSAQALPSFGFVLSNLSSLNLSSSHRRGKGQPPALEMDHGRNNVGLADLKVNIQCLYDIVAIGIMDNRETAKEVKKLVDEVSYIS